MDCHDILAENGVLRAEVARLRALVEGGTHSQPGGAVAVAPQMWLSDWRGVGAEVTARYCRPMLVPEFGVAGQEGVMKAQVVVVGAGGLGSPAIQYLAAAGVGAAAAVVFSFYVYVTWSFRSTLQPTTHRLLALQV
jgi:ThiF family protein